MVQEALEAISSYMLMNIYEEDRKKWFDIWMSEERKNNAYVDNIGAVASGEWVIVLVLRRCWGGGTNTNTHRTQA